MNPGAIAVVVLLSFVLIAAVFDVQSQDVPPVPLVAPSVYDEKLDALNRQAVEEAYRRYALGQFESWMRDPHGQPQRATMGIQKARRAFIDSMTVLDQRRTPAKQ